MAKSTSDAARAQAIGLAKGMMAGLAGGAAGPATGDAPNFGDDHGEDPQGGISLDDLEAASRERQADDQTLRKLFFREAGKKGLTDNRRAAEDDDDDGDDDEHSAGDDDPREEDEESYDDEDDDDGGEDEDDDPRTAKAKRVARSHGLPESAIKAMSRAELLAWSHKASRRESRRNRVFQNRESQGQQRSPSQASDGDRERGTQEPSYARQVKELARRTAESHGLGDDHASALEDFGTALLGLSEQRIAPELATARSVQEAQIKREAERVRQSLGKRFPELSDDEVFQDVMLEAADLLAEGRVLDFDQAVRKAAVIVCESDDGFERRVQSEVKQRHQKARQNGRPQLPRRDRGDASRNAQSRQEAEDKAMLDTFVNLAKGRKGAARKTWNRHAQQQRGRR